MNTQKTYNTKQKSVILDFLKANKGKHFTVDEVALKISESGISIGKTTVYRHLEKLADDLCVRKYEISKNDAACYEYTGNNNENLCSSHSHLKCTVCNKLFHIDCGILNSINEHILSDHDFKVDSAKTVFYGVCKSCSSERV